MGPSYVIPCYTHLSGYAASLTGRLLLFSICFTLSTQFGPPKKSRGIFSSRNMAEPYIIQRSLDPKKKGLFIMDNENTSESHTPEHWYWICISIAPSRFVKGIFLKSIIDKRYTFSLSLFSGFLGTWALQQNYISGVFIIPLFIIKMIWKHESGSKRNHFQKELLKLLFKLI